MFEDLAFLLPPNLNEASTAPPKFLIFFDNIKEAEAATEYLRSKLPSVLKDKIKWFHSIMTPEYRDEEFEDLRNGTTWGLCVTDAFGMVRVMIEGFPDKRSSLRVIATGSRLTGHRHCCPMEDENHALQFMATFWTCGKGCG